MSRPLRTGFMWSPLVMRHGAKSRVLCCQVGFFTHVTSIRSFGTSHQHLREIAWIQQMCTGNAYARLIHGRLSGSSALGGWLGGRLTATNCLHRLCLFTALRSTVPQITMYINGCLGRHCSGCLCRGKVCGQQSTATAHVYHSANRCPTRNDQTSQRIIKQKMSGTTSIGRTAASCWSQHGNELCARA
jgi:hypothetical protein